MKTNYHTQKSDVMSPRGERARMSKSSVPVDKGLKNFFRGTKYLEKKNEDGERADNEVLQGGNG